MTPFRATMHELLTFVQQDYIFISKYPSLGSRAKFNLRKKKKPILRETKAAILSVFIVKD